MRGIFRVFDWRRMMRMFWPVLAEQGFAVMIGILATIMVRSVSGAAMAGVGMLGTLNFLVMNAFTAVASGVTVVVSQDIGGQRYAEAGRASSHSLTTVLYVSLAMGALLTALNRPLLMLLFGSAEPDVIEAAQIYFLWSSISLPLQAIFSTIAGIMRATGNTAMPMAGSILSNVAYLASAGLCIYGLSMGVQGAGVGLMMSRLFPAALLSYWLYRGKAGVYPSRMPLKPSMEVMRPVLRIAVPAGVDSLIFNGGKLVVQVFMSGMGTPVLEANSIANNLAMFLNLPGGSLQIIAVTIVGQTVGAGMRAQAKKETFRLTWVSSLSQLAMSALMFAALNPLINLFEPSSVTFAITRDVMLIMLVFTPLLWSPSFVTPQALRAGGDATYTMWVSIGSMLLLRVLAAWVLGVTLNMGLQGIWLAMMLDWLARAILFLLRTRGMADRNVTGVLQTAQRS